jgi:hypothetical protein
MRLREQQAHPQWTYLRHKYSDSKLFYHQVLVRPTRLWDAQSALMRHLTQEPTTEKAQQ